MVFRGLPRACWEFFYFMRGCGFQDSEDSETWFRPFEIMLFLLKIPNEAEGGLNFGGGAQGEVLHTDSAVL